MPEGRPHFRYLGSFGLKRSKHYARVLITMGLRRRISVQVDDPRGVLRWHLVYKVLPGTLDSPIQLEPNDPLAAWLGKFGPISRAAYVFEFFCMMKASAVSTFIITCLFDGKNYLVEFEDDELTYEMTATQLFTSGVNLVQVDEPDMNTLDDGSLGEATGNEQQI